MREMPQRTNRPLWSDPCRRFFLLLALMPIWIGVAGFVGFTDSVHARFVAVVMAFLITIVVTLPWLLYRLLTRDREPEQDVGLLAWLEGYIDTATGRLEAREFAIQALTALAAAALGLTALGIVVMLVT
jgi:hypothetical protein